MHMNHTFPINKWDIMFIFLAKTDILNYAIEQFHHVNKGIFFINAKSRTTLMELFRFKCLSMPPSKYMLINPRINWIINFNTIYDQIIFTIGRKNIEEILKFFWHFRQQYSESSERSIIRLLLNIHKAKEVEYTQKEILKISNNFLQILKLSNKNLDDALYRMLKGSQKKKVVYLAILCSLLYAAKKNKIIVFLENIDIALCATTPYLRTSIIIKLLSFLELTLCPVIIVVPCSENIFEEYKEMYEWINQQEIERSSRQAVIKSARQRIKLVHISEIRCWTCALLQQVKKELDIKHTQVHYKCPQNYAIPEWIKPHFAEKCRLFKPKS